MRTQHPDDGLILRRAQVLAPAMDALAILDWINDRPRLYFGTIDAAVLAACDALSAGTTSALCDARPAHRPEN